MLCIAAPAGSNVCLSLGIRVSGHDFSPAVDVPTNIRALAPGLFASPGKSRQGLKSLWENFDLQIQPRRGDLKVRAVQISGVVNFVVLILLDKRVLEPGTAKPGWVPNER